MDLWFLDDYEYDYAADYYSDSNSGSDGEGEVISSSSSEDSNEESQNPQPSYMIVDSGPGGIHPRRNSSPYRDDDSSQVSNISSVSSNSNMDSDNSQHTLSDSSQSGASENEAPRGGRYHLRNRTQPQERVGNPRAIIISSDSETDFELNDSPDDDIPAGEVINTGSLPQQPAGVQSEAYRSPANPSLPAPSASAVSEPGPPTSAVSTPGRGEKRKCSSPSPKKARLDETRSEEDSVDAACNICYDDYTAVGPHRPVCLKCGHIFGHSCVERWLKVSCASSNKRCPSCNKKASIKDIRFLYCSNLRAVDNTRVQELSTDLEQEKIANSKYKIEITGYKIKVDALQKELARFKSLEKSGLLQTKSLTTNLSVKFPVLCRVIHLCKGVNGALGLARSLVYDEYKKLLLATHQNDNTIFSGYGYSLFSLLHVIQAPPAQKFCLVSQKAIRDAAFHPNDSDLILIVSLDKTARLIDVRTGTRIHTFNTDFPIWSCAWDQVNPNQFLVGGVNGQLVRFDKRDTSLRGREIATGGTNVGVVSIIGVKPGPGRGLPRGGYLVCKLNAVLALDFNFSPDVLHRLDTSGPFMSMSYLTSKNQVLLSSRPSANFPNIRHRIFTLDRTVDCDAAPVLRLVQIIQGGTLAPSLSRSYIWPEQVQGHSIVYAYDAASKCLCGWSVSDGNKKVSLPCNEAVLDICRVQGDGESMLAALTDSSVRLYRYT